MENQFFVDSEHLSPEALAKKHRIENDPTSRKNHMEYLPGMEIIESDVCSQVMAQMNYYDYSKYTARDVRAALEHTNCSIEDFKALLSPAVARAVFAIIAAAPISMASQACEGLPMPASTMMGRSISSMSI